MRLELLLVVVLLSCAVASALLVGWIRRVALHRGVLDIPNERSSHITPTPVGGGVGIVVTSMLGMAVLWLNHQLNDSVSLALVAGGVLIGVVGYLDDVYRLSVRLRLAVHVVAAVSALWLLGGLPALPVGTRLYDLGDWGDGLAVIAIVWLINLFNFMDGIDGIASSEAAFIALAAAALGTILGHPVAAFAAGVPLAGACIGFLCWNWPPAKIFMGDAGSGYLGYTMAVLALAAARQDPALLWVWLILGGVFVVDASVTLLRRLATGARLSEAHRDHLYQRLALRLGRHSVVTAGVLAINLLWLTPLALWAAQAPRHATWLVLVAWTPLAAAALYCGRSHLKV